MRSGILIILLLLTLFLILVPPAAAVHPLAPKHVMIMDDKDWAQRAQESASQGYPETAYQEYERAISELHDEYWDKTAGISKDRDRSYYDRYSLYALGAANAAHEVNTRAGGDPQIDKEVNDFYSQGSLGYFNGLSVAAQWRVREDRRRQDFEWSNNELEEMIKNQRSGVTFPCFFGLVMNKSPFASEVQRIRDFRDGPISDSYIGSRFMKAFNAWYYSFSPAVAGFIYENPSVTPVMQADFAPLIGIVLISQWVYSVLSFNTEIAALIVLVTGGALYGLIYLLPALFLGIWAAGRKGWSTPAPAVLKPVAALWAGVLVLVIVSAIARIDPVAILSTGLLVAVTVILTASAGALLLSCHWGTKKENRL
ncbi:MAG: hypothetical protein OS112_06285 [Methanoregula sp.]|nr:MAG: hypothetical protein OS112_06285 [Methanoregula sp.]